MNAFHGIGRLVRDLDLRYTSSGKAVGNGTLAVSRYSKGDKKTDYIPFVIWDKQAENLANFTRKGSRISINGSIQTRSYENKENQKVFVVEVLTDGFNGFELLDSKNQGSNESEPQTQPNTQYGNQNANNGTQSFGSDPFEKSSRPIDISDEDLPF